MLKIQRTNKFKKDLKKMQKRGKDLKEFVTVAELLIAEKKLPDKYKNHRLMGNFVGRWECHIQPDWLLIYMLDEESITFERTGSHSDLFR